MNHQRKLLTATLLALLLPLSLGAQTLDLTWKMAFLKGTKGKAESIPFNRPLALVDGDRFQIFIAPATEAYVDVLYEDTTGQLAVLFQGMVKAGDGLTIPSLNEEFGVTPPGGTEKIHVIVSTKPQTALQATYKGLPKGSRAVLDELARLRTSLSSLAEAPEKPVPMGGVNRSLLPKDTKMSEFKGQTTYVKTIRYDH